MKHCTRVVAPASRSRGVSLIEIMVGLVIGMIAIAVVLQVFSVAEQYKRNTTSAGDAQQNGLFSTFTMALELANAGNGIATTATDLATCPNTNDLKTILRPLTVVIEGDDDASVPDAFTVIYSAATRVAYPALFVAAAPAGSAYQVQSPNGFAVNDMVIAVGGGQCAQTKVTAVSAPDGVTGVVTITHSGAAVNFPASSVLVNMGPETRTQRTTYRVNPATGILTSQNLINDAPPQPLAANVVNMKVQYGIDTDNDTFVNTWVPATAAPWRAQDLMGATIQRINQIKAIRIGVIVRSAQFDQNAGAFSWRLFDCSAPPCAGMLEDTIDADPQGGGYRYRTYETVIPLRNQLWNPQLL